MWSIEGAVLIWIACCAGVIVQALRGLRKEIEPTRRSFDLLHREVTLAVELTTRNTGRAAASRRLLVRHGNAPASR
jgi:hypothetical protein